MKNNTVGIMMGLCGDEFWKIGETLNSHFGVKCKLICKNASIHANLKS